MNFLVENLTILGFFLGLIFGLIINTYYISINYIVNEEFDVVVYMFINFPAMMILYAGIFYYIAADIHGRFWSGIFLGLFVWIINIMVDIHKLAKV